MTLANTKYLPSLRVFFGHSSLFHPKKEFPNQNLMEKILGVAAEGLFIESRIPYRVIEWISHILGPQKMSRHSVSKEAPTHIESAANRKGSVWIAFFSKSQKEGLFCILWTVNEVNSDWEIDLWGLWITSC